MKDFIKSVLATITGILIVGGIFMSILLLIVASTIASSMKSETVFLEDNSILKITFAGTIKDRINEIPFLEYFGVSEINEMSLTDIISAIKKAKVNPKIKGIYINSGYFSASSASLKEIRDELIDFKSSGKPIIAYADDYLQGGYYLSSVADRIIVNPQGTLDLHGISVNSTFYKGLLDKLGIEMQVFKVGTYKSAVEPYILDKMSDANKEQVSSFINNLWSTILTEISNSRNISIEHLNNLSDTLPALRGADFYIKEGLVDELRYESDMKTYLDSLFQIKESKDLHVVSIKELNIVPDLKNNKSTNQIAVLYAEGNIVGGKNRMDISDGYFVKQIKKLQEDSNVKAVVFRVNSPGGSAYASEQIWKAVSDLKKKKPVVVSMGDYAASGGYYISCNASKIYAQPTTLTGSIGIFGMFPNFSGLTNKVGLAFDGVKTNKYSDLGSVTRPMREDEKQLVQGYINRGYDLFLTRCSEGRHIPKASLDSIAQGRVWTGSQALSLGLVDELGGIDEAISGAAQLAEIDNYYINEYPKILSPFDMFLKNKENDIATWILKGYLDNDFELLKTIKDIKDLKEQDYIQARMPYYITF